MVKMPRYLAFSIIDVRPNYLVSSLYVNLRTSKVMVLVSLISKHAVPHRDAERHTNQADLGPMKKLGKLKVLSRQPELGNAMKWGGRDTADAGSY